MILVGFNIVKISIGILLSSIFILIAIILYRKLLLRMNRGEITKKDYCVLYGLENNPAKGLLEFYFTCESPKSVVFEILNKDFESIRTIFEADVNADGHIVRFDSTELENGTYYYQLKTENQKTSKKMIIFN